MDRNAPCPCGSGRKYKKCHGAAVPPEAAALPPDARAEWLRGDAVLQRQRRVGNELLDWADRKMGAEWVDVALDAWGVRDDDDVDEAVADLFSAWSLFNFRPVRLSTSIAAAWVDDAAGRKADDDMRRLVIAAIDSPLGLWEVETVEPGVGTTLTDRLTDTTVFVHEPDLTHTIGHGDFILAYVLNVDGVSVFSGLHADPLLFIDRKPLLASILSDAGVSAVPVPPSLQRDPAWQLRITHRWTETVEQAYAEMDAGEEDDDDIEPAR